MEQHTGPQSLFAGVGGGPWNNTRGRSLCLQVGVVVGGGLGTTHGAAVFVCRWGLLWGGPWNNTRGRSLCLQLGVVVGGALEQHTGPQSLFAGRGCCRGGALEQHMGPQSLFAGQAQSNIQGFVLFVRLVI